MSTRQPGKWIGKFILVSLVLVVIFSNVRGESYSCHLCREREVLQTWSLFVWPLRRSWVVSFPGRAGANHVHDWWRFSRSYSDGLGGWLGSGVGCNADRYRDGSTAP
jgi:hypothetical protein